MCGGLNEEREYSIKSINTSQAHVAQNKKAEWVKRTCCAERRENRAGGSRPESLGL